ncbi:HepT-like ribonuclease domain-containing protein [Glycomyces buryatensis]|uniref:DUF86 domain-containing protein n=1 Tax=Glycomyces buryatensis TaxID=2570927 RepID=A0A4S8Q9G0_9ACTN|nr:HepT-like ribonuclease domain-containing protein [Glycomyces buryatensis]THV41093.1 DUF86 domain-containing protein [Glycomyces buryatensis]
MTREYRLSFQSAAKAGAITQELASELAPSASMRNIIVHGYLEVDNAVVAESIPRFRRDYREYVRQVAQYTLDLDEE